MTEFILVPPDRMPADTLQALLEEYASRDGTDYGEVELSLEQKVANLVGQLQREDIHIVYDTLGEQWDIVPREQAEVLLNS